MVTHMVKFLLLSFCIMILASCGGGSGGVSGASVALTLASNTIDSGASVSGSLKITGRTTVNNIQPSIKTDSPDLIVATATKTNINGDSAVVITANNPSANTRTAKVWAVCEGVPSNIIIVTVNAGLQTGSLALSVNNTSPVPGSIITATAQYTNTSSTAILSPILISFSSNNSSIITDTSATTDSTGKAIVNITIPPTAPQNTQVVLTASAETTNGAVISLTPVTITIAASNSLTLSMGTTSEFTRTVLEGSEAGSINIVVQGNKVTFTGPQGVIPNQLINISIDRIDNWRTGDSVTVNGSVFTGVNPSGSVSLNTDTTGTALIPTVITGVLPAAGAAGSSISHVFVIYWRATTTYGGLNYISTGSTMFTGTTTAEEEPEPEPAPVTP